MHIPRFSSIQGRLGFVFLTFLLLLVISVVVTFMGLETQKQDARTINLAGRQRMLSQQMTSLALAVEYEGGDANSSALVHAADSFALTLAALEGGGQFRDYTGENFAIASPHDPSLIAELNALEQDWHLYRSKIDQLVELPGSPGKDRIVKEIEDLSPSLTDQADRVVRAFETVSTQKVARLRTFQILFLLAGLVLLSTGWWVTRRSVVLPLSWLEKSAQRIGEGDLSSPVEVKGPIEVQVLGATMETMRSQILASRQALQQGAETLENRVRQRTLELEALSTVSQEINSHLSIQEVLSSVTQKAQKLMGAEVASLCLLDPQGKVLSLHATAGPESAIRNDQSPADGPIVGKILQEHCAQPCGIQICSGFCQIIDPRHRASHMASPLYSGQKVIGALCVGSSTADLFRPEMTGVLTQLSQVASVALENSRLYQQAEHVAALEERQRIASEMHDGLLQTLSFLRMMVLLIKEQHAQGNTEQVITTLQQIERADEQAEREIRRAISTLQENFPTNDTLQECLGVLAEELSASGPPVLFETAVVVPLVLSRQESEQALRVAREAILNAQRYSQSDQVRVCLEKTASEMIVSISDQGIGFDPKMVPEDGRSHFGMNIMNARAARLGGKLVIRSAPGEGTTVRLSWPPAQAHLD